jgi:outer membrane receptor protein involved in Fe transport
MGVSAGVNNIFDVSYYEHLNRRIVGSTEKLYEPGRMLFVNLNLSI